jgi:hypothetical protein
MVSNDTICYNCSSILGVAGSDLLKPDVGIHYFDNFKKYLTILDSETGLVAS